MTVNPKRIYWSLGGIIIVGFTLTLFNMQDASVESDEAKLMSAACDDVKTYEILRAENDFDEILEVIHSHLFSYWDQSDTILTKAIADISILREEAVFRNTDQEFYHQRFAKVLIQ